MPLPVNSRMAPRPPPLRFACPRPLLAAQFPRPSNFPTRKDVPDALCAPIHQSPRLCLCVRASRSSPCLRRSCHALASPSSPRCIRVAATAARVRSSHNDCRPHHETPAPTSRSVLPRALSIPGASRRQEREHQIPRGARRFVQTSRRRRAPYPGPAVVFRDAGIRARPSSPPRWKAKGEIATPLAESAPVSSWVRYEFLTHKVSMNTAACSVE